MINKMKMLWIAIVCCGMISIGDLQASARRMPLELTPQQKLKILGSLFTGKFIANPQVYSEAGDTIKELVESILNQNPNASQIDVVQKVYDTISNILPEKFLKGGLMPFIKEVVADHWKMLEARGR
jgi:hypothetical protein